MKIHSIGFPRMNKEESERRDFVPLLFRLLQLNQDIEILVEEDYGIGMGFGINDYLLANDRIKILPRREVFNADMVVVLRTPEEDELKWMKPGAVIFSMLHYDTRESRNNLLQELQIIPFSMDGIEDDWNRRMVVNYSGTSYSGVEVAFNELKKKTDHFKIPGNRPIYAGILGFGAVGLEAAKALKYYSDHFFLNNESETPGMIINLYPRSITENPKILKEQLNFMDILVDASRRRDPTQYIIENSWLEEMPSHGIILDLSADPYNTDISPIQVKGIEGIPTGTLDQLVFGPEDPAYDSIPEGVDTTHRRTVVSCNAWPGVDPIGCMTLYSKQLIYFLRELISKDPENLSIQSDDPYERALVRSSLAYFLENHNKS
ncbi:hypothetical protein [Gudongella sp. DL1XJH-153]|uniref:hypothetical protein n=1 Tax=Gudongella sp. DL1XJH-153 TaxID=3409804 RepID=UPI003BB4EE4F